MSRAMPDHELVIESIEMAARALLAWMTAGCVTDADIAAHRVTDAQWRQLRRAGHVVELVHARVEDELHWLAACRIREAEAVEREAQARIAGASQSQPAWVVLDGPGGQVLGAGATRSAAWLEAEALPRLPYAAELRELDCGETVATVGGRREVCRIPRAA